MNNAGQLPPSSFPTPAYDSVQQSAPEKQVKTPVGPQIFNKAKIDLNIDLNTIQQAKTNLKSRAQTLASDHPQAQKTNSQIGKVEYLPSPPNKPPPPTPPPRPSSSPTPSSQPESAQAASPEERCAFKASCQNFMSEVGQKISDLFKSCAKPAAPPLSSSGDINSPKDNTLTTLRSWSKSVGDWGISCGKAAAGALNAVKATFSKETAPAAATQSVVPAQKQEITSENFLKFSNFFVGIMEDKIQERENKLKKEGITDEEKTNLYPKQAEGDGLTLRRSKPTTEPDHPVMNAVRENKTDEFIQEFNDKKETVTDESIREFGIAFKQSIKELPEDIKKSFHGIINRELDDKIQTGDEASNVAAMKEAIAKLDGNQKNVLHAIIKTFDAAYEFDWKFAYSPSEKQLVAGKMENLWQANGMTKMMLLPDPDTVDPMQFATWTNEIQKSPAFLVTHHEQIFGQEPAKG